MGGVSLGIAAAGLTLGAVSWWVGEGLEPFRLKDTGFFGRHTYAGGSDKAGHFFANAVGVRVMADVYRALDVPHDRALWYAVAFTFLLANGVEVIDGFTPHRFEYGDALLNSVGQAVGALLEFYPALAHCLGFRMSYVPSALFLQREKNYVRLANDYSGQLLFIDLKPRGLLRALNITPGLARFVWFGATYGTFDYRPKHPAAKPRRNLGMHVSIAWPEVFEVLGLGRPGEIAGTVLSYLALPFTSVGLAHDLNEGGWRVTFGVANRFEVPL